MRDDIVCLLVAAYDKMFRYNRTDVRDEEKLLNRGIRETTETAAERLQTQLETRETETEIDRETFCR